MSCTIYVTSTTGEEFRLAADEPNAVWVPFGVWWESQVPGGWKSGGWNLRRRIDADIELRLLDEVVILDPDGEPVYEGRIVKLPRQHGEDFLLGVECIGWAAHLLDDKQVPYFYVDRMAGSWGAPPLARRVQYGSFPWEVDYRASVDGGYIGFEGPTDKQALQFSVAELAYQAPPGARIGGIGYKGTEANTTNVEAATLYTDDDPAYPSPASNSLTLDDTVRQAVVAAPVRYATLRAMASATHTPPAALNRRLSQIAVYGDHGLTGVDIAGDQDGFYIDDMLAHALALACPKLNFTTGDGGSIERPSVVVPHAADNTLGPVERIVLDLNKSVLYDWLVYKNRTFHFRATDPDRLTWEARLDRGIHLSLEGDDAEHAYNSAIVQYEVPGEGTRWAGPLGSGLDVESELLGITDPENTVNAHGYPARQIEITVQFGVALDDYAVAIGAAYLLQAALPARSGTIDLVGEVEHPTMGMRPVREMLAGEYVLLSDHPADVPRRMIHVRVSEDERKASVTVGNDMNTVDAILEQVGVRTRIVQGG